MATPQRIALPIKGISERMPVEDTSPATTFYIKNVRCPGTLEKQVRLSQRPGSERWSTTRLSGATAAPIVAMTVVQVAV